MIETATAKNGSLIYLKDGKYLASSFDPQKEAEAWWKTCSQRAKYARTVFVLGLGAGYHIQVLKRELAQTKIVVIEPDQELVTIYQSTNSEELEILCEQDWRRLFNYSPVSSGVQSTYAVLLHPPSYGVETEYFGNAYKFLLGRSMDGLFALLKNRPDLLAELDEAKLADLARSPDPVSIRTITKAMKAKAYADQDRRIWKVLEELLA